MNSVQRKIFSAVALGQSTASLVLKNAKVINVFTNEILEADIAIENGVIAGVGRYSGLTELDYSGQHIIPGLIDAHLHVESSLVSPDNFIMSALRCGTTTFIVDPHESANVSGAAGIDYILDQTQNLPANVYVMLPSCVPAMPFELNGCKFDSNEMLKYRSNPRILGLGEVMDFFSVINNDVEMSRKLDQFADGIIDGHAPALTPEQIAAYAMAGISSDHECDTYEYARLERRCGMHIHIREGSVAHNLEAIVKGMIEHGDETDTYSFCTDDKHIDDIMREGHINACLAKAVALGLPAVKAIRMATLNTARHYHLKTKGAIAPGFDADLVVVSDLESFRVVDVFHAGKKIKWTRPAPVPCNPVLKNTVNLGAISPESIRLRVKETAPIIHTIPGLITNELLYEPVPHINGIFTPTQEYNKVVVMERYSGEGKCGIGIVKGFSIKNAAIATTVSHDSHNIIAIGDNDRDILYAIVTIKDAHGGYVIVSGGEIIDLLPLPIMGLMSELPYAEVSEKLRRMHEISIGLGVNPQIDPFFALSFFALPVIPNVRITPHGLYDVMGNCFLN